MREPAPLGPALVHPQQHLAPVLGVDTAVLGVDLHDGVGLVVGAGEQAAQVELVEALPRSTRSRRRSPAPATRRPPRGRGRGAPRRRTARRRGRRRWRGRRGRWRTRRSAPWRARRRPRGRAGPSRPPARPGAVRSSVDLQVARRLRRAAAAQVAQVVGEVTHDERKPTLGGERDGRPAGVTARGRA